MLRSGIQLTDSAFLTPKRALQIQCVNPPTLPALAKAGRRPGPSQMWSFAVATLVLSFLLERRRKFAFPLDFPKKSGVLTEIDFPISIFAIFFFDAWRLQPQLCGVPEFLTCPQTAPCAADYRKRKLVGKR